MQEQRGIKRALPSSNNDKMHDRNPYKKSPPDFKQLASLYPSFAEHVITKGGSATLDWNNPESLCELTKALLHKDFGVTIELPLDQLCPTVTSRVNYILWLEDLLGIQQRPKSTKKQKTGTESQPASAIRGIDIGTGASCIYPLLGYSMNNWRFTATDIDENSVKWAQKNVSLNNWGDFIQVIHKSSEDIILSLFSTDTSETPEAKVYDFCMCNPPFFENIEQKIDNPRTQCNATSGELVTEGGEVAFVTKMIEESLILRHQVTWYTSLLGRKVSVKKLLKTLHEKGIKNTRTTTFYQGHTTRWAVAWSFGEIQTDLRKLAIDSFTGKKEFIIGVSGIPVKHLVEDLERVLRERQISWNNDPDDAFAIYANVYESSQWLKESQENSEEEEEEEEDEGEGEENKSQMPVGIGPMMPPRVGFSFDINIYQLSHQQYNVKIIHTGGDHLRSFAELFVDMKAQLQNTQ
eukprot:TRINITY_DN442_c1_g1_i1.p1 TRINITY_DN442_c1_g1~~TRINITY_DN442_c1_g1_i1.p1  ORF type:complete len:464 (+),score=88.72 TRINITY_DN442_c1_g1_i1:31-1422(+)